MSDTVTKKLLAEKILILVSKSIEHRAHTINLRTEVLLRDNSELLGTLEKIKGMTGVQDVIWGEVIEVVGRQRLDSQQSLS